MRKSTYYALATLCSAIVVSFSATAVTFEVTTAEEFQAALSAAASNGGDDEILLASGSYEGNFKYSAAESYDLSISSNSNSGSVVLDAKDRSIGLLIDGRDHSFDLVISDLTIVNGYSEGNAGALTIGRVRGNARLSGLLLENNQASIVVLVNNVEDLVIEDSRFFSNRTPLLAPSKLIGIEGELDFVRLSKLQVVENIAAQLIFVDSRKFNLKESKTTLIIEESIFRQNEVGNISSSVYWYMPNESEVVIRNNSFKKNSAGVIVSNASYYKSHVTFEQNEIKENNCTNGGIAIGGAPRNYSYKIQVERNYFEKNAGCSVYLSGRENYADAAEIRVANNFFGSAGVELSFDGDQSKANIEFFNNTRAACDSALTLRGNLDTSVDVSNNILNCWSDASIKTIGLLGLAKLRNNFLSGLNGVWDVEEGNDDLDPIFADPTNSDFHLDQKSPAIDAGSNTAVSAGDLDLDGNNRVLNGTVDIGAYERSTAALHPADTNGDSSISREEFDAYNTAWRRNESWPNPPVSIEADYVTRAGYLLQKGGAYKNIGVGKPVTWVPLNE